jgi:hypothetical protein
MAPTIVDTSSSICNGVGVRRTTRRPPNLDALNGDGDLDVLEGDGDLDALTGTATSNTS